MNFFLTPLRKYEKNYGIRKTYQTFFKKLDITLLGLAPIINIANAIDISPFTGLFLPGGGDINPQEYNSNLIVDYDFDIDVTERKLFKEFVNQNKPILGVCRGLQVINVFQGGTLKNVDEHMETEHLIKYKNSRRLVNSYHHQAIDKLGKNIKVLSRSLDKNIEVITSKQIKMLAFQFHPELMKEDEQNYWIDEIKTFLY